MAPNSVFFWFSCFTLSSSLAIQPAPAALRLVDFSADAAIDAVPRFAWTNSFTGSDAHQTAYRVLVEQAASTIWDSGRVNSPFRSSVVYSGPSLLPASHYSWKVQTWDNNNSTVTPFSEPMPFVTGIFSSDQWAQTTKWIAAPQARVGLANAFWIAANDTAVEKTFEIPNATIESALTSLTATHAVTLLVNGRMASNVSSTWEDAVIDLDISPYLKPGLNCLTLTAQHEVQGTVLRSEVRTQGGNLTLVVTDGSWTNRNKRPVIVVAPYFAAPWSTWQILTKGGTVLDPPPIMRRSLSTSAQIVTADLFIAGLGQHQAFLNGKKVGSSVMDQAWTDFEQRTTYTVFDVTDLVRSQSANVLGVELANGWFDYQTKSVTERWGLGEAGIEYTKNYGIMRLWCELRIRYGDGALQVISSDEDWKISTGPWALTHVFGSESYDFRKELPGWNDVGYDDSEWSAANTIDAPTTNLVSQRTPSIKVTKSHAAVPHSSGPGYEIYDIGVNVNGQLEITMDGSVATTFNIVAGERIIDGRVKGIGNDYNDTSAGSYITYSTIVTAGNQQPEVYRQIFSTCGFRYVEVQRVADLPPPSVVKVTGHQVHADLPSNGRFHSSNTTYMRVYDLLERSLHNNMVSIHTDCPTYEKLGWQEVVATLARSYSFISHAQPWLSSILVETRQAQYPDGLIPNIAPAYTQGVGVYRDAPAWGHAIIEAPYRTYMAYDDPEVLRDNYLVAKKYYEYLKTKAVNRTVNHGLGDWVSPSGQQVANVEGAVFVNAAATLSSIALALDQTADAEYYSEEFRSSIIAYNEAHLWAYNCSYIPTVQANQAIPLAYGIVPPNASDCVRETLLDIIAEPRNTTDIGFGQILPDHIATGEIGLLPLLNTLRSLNRDDLVERMVFQEDEPGFYALVLRNQTALPEQWNHKEARSLNHDMFATLTEWYYTALGGISERQAGFASFDLKPAFHLALKDAEVHFQSIRGLISSSWNTTSIDAEHSRVLWTVKIPSDSFANIYFPHSNQTICWSRDGSPTRGASALPLLTERVPTSGGAFSVARFGSGCYSFEFTIRS